MTSDGADLAFINAEQQRPKRQGLPQNQAPMELTPREKDKLLIFTAALLAIMEGARDGKSVAALMSDGKTVLTRDDVMEGIAELIPEIQVEATFPDGTKLVTVHQPIA
jgi:urease subunit gamma